MNDAMITMRLHEIDPCFYDPRADFLVAVALDDDTSAKAETRLLREAERIYNTARVVIRAGKVNVRANVINVLRKVGA
jgi:hypothetical protein